MEKEWWEKISKEVWSKMDEKKARYTLEQVQLQMGEILDGIKSLENKAYILLTISIGIINGLIGSIAFNIDKIPDDNRTWVFLGAVVYLGCAGWATKKFINVISPYDYNPSGNNPSNLLREDSIEEDISMFMINGIIPYEKRIIENRDIAAKKAKNLVSGIQRLLYVPTVLAILSVLIISL